MTSFPGEHSLVSVHGEVHLVAEIPKYTDGDKVTCDQLGASVTQGRPAEVCRGQPAEPGEASGAGQLLERTQHFGGKV